MSKVWGCNVTDQECRAQHPHTENPPRHLGFILLMIVLLMKGLTGKGQRKFLPSPIMILGELIMAAFAIQEGGKR